jgi:hypothetical protein
VGNLYDLRQVEKERFARLVASAPSRLEQVSGSVGEKVRRAAAINPPSTHQDIRQKEKERLAAIFATSIGTTNNNNKYNCRRPTPLLEKENVPQINLINSSSQVHIL